MTYVLPHLRSRYECRVHEAGYPYTQIVKLNPPHIIDPLTEPFRLQNRLNEHEHHSTNTHYIIKGSLTITCADGTTGTIDEYGEKEFTVPEEMPYHGEPGPEGATFVEGHSILSPTTAARFERRCALIWFDDAKGKTREEWIEEEKQKRLAAIQNGRLRLRPVYG